mgnify:CR=1 FL=1
MSRPEPLRTLPEQAFRARARLVALLLCGICFAGLIARLYWLQLAAGDWYTRRALGQQLRDTVVPADRGRIYSADGVLLAANSSCWTLRASPREMPADKLELAAHGLAQILELDEAALLEKFRDRASNDCLLRYRVERSMADAVRDFCEENGITGIRINQDSKRWYPQGEFLASVLGFTNVDNTGVSGLELEYNEQLTGQNGVVLTAVNAWGYTLEQSYETEQFPVEGSSLWLTIDANIQHYLENALNYAVQEHHVAARAVGIVLDVNTGAVLAMSTTPAYDPNQPRILYDEAARAAVDALSGEQRAAALQLAQQTQWRNKAVSDLYEPDMDEPARVVLSHNIVGVFAKQKAQCEGIAKAVKVLLNAVDIKCIVATGEAEANGKKEHHAWNVIDIDGSPYQVDVTWDIGASKGRIAYDYFNVTDEIISRTHSFEDEMPKCISLKDNYFERNRLTFRSRSQLIVYITQEIEQGRNKLYFRIDGLFPKLRRSELAGMVAKIAAGGQSGAVKVQQIPNEKVGTYWIRIY